MFRFEVTDGQIRLGYKDRPKPEENNRFMDVTMCVANFSDLPYCQVNMKEDATLDKMRGDLSKWVESGRLYEEEETWWMCYLDNCVRETRLRPGVPKSTELPKYACPQAVPNEDLTSLEQAID